MGPSWSLTLLFVDSAKQQSKYEHVQTALLAMCYVQTPITLAFERYHTRGQQQEIFSFFLSLVGELNYQEYR